MFKKIENNFKKINVLLKAKIFSDVESVENLLIDDADLDRGGLVGVGGRNKDELLHEQPRDTAIDDEDPHFGMGGGGGGGCDDFEMPCGTANTNEPFYSQNGGQFLPATLTQDNHNHNHHDIDMNMDGFAANGGHLEQRFDGSNLIEAPMQVNVLNIEYAKTSKNIDVRRLKQVIWQLLCESSETATTATATWFDEDKVNKFYIQKNKTPRLWFIFKLILNMVNIYQSRKTQVI